MKAVSLTVFSRTQVGRSGVKKLRQAERIPAVIYGRQAPPQNLEVPLLDLKRLLHHAASENILLDLRVEGDPRPNRLALLQEIQHHPLASVVLHLDLHEVAADEKVTVSVPVETLGEAAGVKEGGVLEHVLFKLRVRALPQDLPDQLEVDVSHLNINQALHIGDITPPPNVEILGEKKLVVVAVAPPVVETVETPAAEAGAEGLPEPEVIKEKKEEGAEPGAKAGEKGEKPEKGEKGEKGEKSSEKGADKKK